MIRFFLRHFAFAFAFLTRLSLPTTKTGLHEGTLASSMGLFPLVGALIGAAGGLVFLLASSFLPPLPSALIAIAALTLLTGALHEDGLADMIDGFGGGHDPKAKLKIMKDSLIGTYGALALFLSVSLRAALLAALPGMAGLWALIAAHTLSRATLPLILVFMRPARSDGLGANAGIPDKTTIAIALALAAMIVLPILPFPTVMMAIAAAAIAALIVAIISRRQIGGFTGDILGAIQQCAEIAVLLVVVGASS